MASTNGVDQLHRRLKQQNHAIFVEGIYHVFSRWTALQLAVQNEWGGRLSRHKEEMLASAVFNFFIQSKGPILVCDLVDLLDDEVSESFNLQLEDRSIQNVADGLMLLHNELLYDDMTSIERLRNATPSDGVSRSQEEVQNEDGETSNSEASDMAVDEQESGLEANAEGIRVEQQQQTTVEVEEGWSIASSRRRRGRRH